MLITRAFLLTFFMSALLSACSTAPGNFLDTSRLEDKDPTPTATYPVHLITADTIAQEEASPEAAQPLPPARFADASQYVYRIAPQDILGITLWDHPELTTPQGSTLSTGGNTTQTVAGALQQPYAQALPGQADPYGQTVSANGTIFFPFIGKMRVAGKTTGEIREEMTAALSPYIKNPQLDVRVLAYRGQRIAVTGEVKQPGPLAVSDVPLTLVDAITRSGGTTAEADLQRVRLTRNGKLYVLDANGMLDRGDISQNVMLQAGDILNIPDRYDSRIFVMGEVKTPMPVNMVRGRASVADALTQAGGVLDTDANVRQIYVVRRVRDNPSRPDIYRLDMSQPDSLLLSTQFQLRPLDVVYVGTTGAVQFNRLINQVLPTLQTLFYMKQLTR
ncbi:capsular polysaccharide biosynthesis/export periplasmic protein [Caballeronia calidae]|uniref:Capsular polysaccharide biosynthesis/export periplasmic protein n=1 Tax=Caballeronia calidae TaxID=1777139 RepID=A0A157ZMN3_9BURK|nr:polysaccharide biosynthesis/export family protein [Caballeronia calidae]SAK46784.1 capsular polysaccharide biosynthesis/export periplasmic protein [Caballeronia calidae]